MNSQIADAGEQQKTVIDKIQRNINTISEISSKTTNDTNSLSNFCKELVELSAHLKDLVGKFST